MRVLGARAGVGRGGVAAGGAGLFYFFKLYRGFQDEQFVDVLTLPFHYQAHNRKMGEYFLKLGDIHLKNNRLPDGHERLPHWGG